MRAICRNVFMGVGMLAMAAMTLGCESGGKSLDSEVESLRTENGQLRTDLAATRSQLESVEAERARLIAEIAAGGSKPKTPAPAARSTAFEGIEGIEIETAPGGQITVRVPGDILFDSGKITLRSGAQSTLRQIAQVLTRSYPGKTVRVEGYTDTDPIRKSGWDDNLELSVQRAMAVQRYLASQGVRNPMYSAGFGEHRPRGSKQASRRVEIIVVGE